ncbi:hypothetical protein GH733_007377 [Mirounga leonina]|nr:hypothetical protein GH733_007377 [Mirounga leonina]
MNQVIIILEIKPSFFVLHHNVQKRNR